MYKRIGIALMVLAVWGLLLPLLTVTAASERPDDGVVIWNEDYTLAENESLQGDLVVFNGDVTLEAGSQVSGDVVVWNGNIDVDGLVDGNLVAANGRMRLGENARIAGDVVCTWNCDMEQAEGSRVEGELVSGLSVRGMPFGNLVEPSLRISRPRMETRPLWLSGPEAFLRWVLRLFRAAATVLVVAITGGLVALIWPDATSRAGQAAFDSPGASFGVGLLTVVAAGALMVALAVTICLSPLAMLLALALAAAGLFGWLAVGARVGARLLGALDAGEVTPLWSAGLGTLIITLVTVGLSNALCLSPLGWFLVFVIGSLGLGAVVLTRLGTTTYVPTRRSTLSAPATPHVDAEHEEEAVRPALEGQEEA